MTPNTRIPPPHPAAVPTPQLFPPIPPSPDSCGANKGAPPPPPPPPPLFFLGRGGGSYPRPFWGGGGRRGPSEGDPQRMGPPPWGGVGGWGGHIRGGLGGFTPQKTVLRDPKKGGFGVSPEKVVSRGPQNESF